MIDAATISEKLGKRKFKEFVESNRPRGKNQEEYERGRKWGRIRFRMCKHMVWIIDDYQNKSCNKCVPVSKSKGRDFEPHFNIALGGYIESKTDFKKALKEAGAVHVGTDKINI